MMIRGSFSKKEKKKKKEVMIEMLSAFSQTTENYVLVISYTVIAILPTNVHGEILHVQIKAR